MNIESVTLGWPPVMSTIYSCKYF